MPKHILFVDDDPFLRRSIKRSLRKFDVRVTGVGDARDALKALDSTDFTAVVTDYYMPPGPTGIWLLENVMHQHPEVRRVLFSGYEVPHERDLLRIGMVHSFLRKPLKADVLADALATESPRASAI